MRLDHDMKQLIGAVASAQQKLPLEVMSKWNGFPQANGVGRMFVGRTHDGLFKANEIITWENTAGRSSSTFDTRYVFQHNIT